MSKSLAVVGILVDALGIRLNYLSDKYANLLFDNANTGYAEVRTIHIYLISELTNLFYFRSETTFHDIFIYSLAVSGSHPIHPQTPSWMLVRLLMILFAYGPYTRVF